jgi:hypothetical protein
MFPISYGVLLKPLPFRADRQLFDVVESTAKGDETFAASYPEITQWQQANSDIANVAFASNYVNIIDAPAGAEMISSESASPKLFSLLGVEPIIGRGFMPDETISDHPNVVLLSYDVWQRSFAGDRTGLSNGGLRAAVRLFLTQPAVSRALQRLRDMFHDDLLIRTSTGYAPTRKGQDLLHELESAQVRAKHMGRMVSSGDPEQSIFGRRVESRAAQQTRCRYVHMGAVLPRYGPIPRSNGVARRRVA